jgi:hypothetical protein
MSVVDTETIAALDLAQRVALVRAQLAPIPSRPALLDSYRRESICRLASAASADSAAAVLELAYAARWAELEPESPVADDPDSLAWEYPDG